MLVVGEFEFESIIYVSGIVVGYYMSQINSDILSINICLIKLKTTRFNVT